MAFSCWLSRLTALSTIGIVRHDSISEFTSKCSQQFLILEKSLFTVKLDQNCARRTTVTLRGSLQL
jgi:hypothetical protein